MKIKRHPQFNKHFQARIAGRVNLVARFYERVELFISQPFHPILQNHGLTGKYREYRSISITGDIRVIYRELENDTVLFFDIGTHNQVY